MSKRRPLTEDEELFCTVAFQKIQTRFLHHQQRYLLNSLQSQFDWDKRLSDAQLKALKKLKQCSDYGIRQEAIDEGNLDPDYFKKLNREEYLQSRYSPIGKATLYETRRS